MSEAIETDVPFWQRADITSGDLARLKRKSKQMLQALTTIQEAAALDIAMGVVTSNSAIWSIEKDAREVIKEVK